MKHEEIKSLLTQLHLPAIKKRFEEEAKLALAETENYEQYLLRLLRIESEERFNRRTERLLKESKLPLEKRMDNFDIKRLPLKISMQVKTLMDGTFLNRAENVLVFGGPGTGKTHLLCAIGQKLIHSGRSIYFAKCSLLVQELLIAKKDLKLQKYLKHLSKYEAIIIDDIGYVQQNREEMEVLFTLFAERYERQSLMITTNLPFSKWENIFKDPMTTAAAIDRMVHHSIILEMELPSYRMEQALARKKETHADNPGETNKETKEKR
jgi:DNA replication protein DnaC